MRGWWNRILLLLIVGMTVFSAWVAWPSEPDRYLPDAIPWPEGQGVPFNIFGKEIPLKLPTIEGGTFGVATLERREMSLGLDLRGGTRLVLEPVSGAEATEAQLEGALRVIERRVNAFGVAESEVTRLGNNRISVQLPGIEPDEAKEKIGRTGLLQFCEPLTDESGNVAIARAGVIQYQAQTCEPARNADGNIIVEGGEVEFAGWPPGSSGDPYATDSIVWTPATAEIDGVEKTLDGQFLRLGDIFVTTDPVLNRPILAFAWNGEGADISEQVTARLAAEGMPLANFLDGEPIRGEDGTILAPTVQSTITSQGQITGLSLADAQELSTLLSAGAFPVRLEVVQQQAVDATLGETAVRNSVIAGEVALLLIMLFMVLYYRVPGLIASLALVVYASLLLGIFKLWPITLTLAGVGAFVISVGMAIDANILIFERMKEELRVGRNIIVALEDGFNRAWSSIRDSNISTLITCGILYWFGNQFDEAAIKGFAIVLAIGVLVSMFSAIIVTRTFMRAVIGFRWLTRRTWLFVPDLPDDAGSDQRQAPAVAGGSDGQPRAGRRER